MAALLPGNYYSLIELSDKTSDAQAVIFTCRLNNNSSNVFLLAKTGYIVKIECVPLSAGECSLRGVSGSVPVTSSVTL